MKLEIIEFFCISPIFSFVFVKSNLDKALNFNVFQLLHLEEKFFKNTSVFFLCIP